MNPETSYTLAYRNNLKGRFCDCGDPAVINRQGDWICARCKRLEEARRARENRRDLAGQHTYKQSGIEPYRILLPA